MELASLADAAPPGHQEFLNILANGSGAGCGKAAMIQTILLEQDFGQRYKAPLGAAEEQPCSSQANITFRYPLDVDAMFMSNPPSPSAAPEGDSDVAASASESGPSMPTQRPRWLQEISDAETIDSHHQPPAKKRDKDEVSSGNSPDDSKKPTSEHIKERRINQLQTLKDDSKRVAKAALNTPSRHRAAPLHTACTIVIECRSVPPRYY